MEVEKVVESLGRVRACWQRRTLLEVGGNRVRWLFVAIDASTPRITPWFLNVHLLFLLPLFPSSTPFLWLQPPPPFAASFRFIECLLPFPFSMERRVALSPQLRPREIPISGNLGYLLQN